MPFNQESMIFGESRSAIIQAVKTAVKAFVDLPTNKEEGEKRSSGYFSLRNNESSQIMMLERINDVPPKKVDDYFTFTLEKGLRLFHHPEHNSSHQSKDADQKKYPGAIRIINMTDIKNPLTMILSFSGLPALGDESCMLVASVLLNWCHIAMAENIAQISNNPHFFLHYKRACAALLK